MENKSFTVTECIRAAELDCVKAGKCVRHEDEQTLYLASIAESLLAIAKMFNTDYQESFPDGSSVNG